MSSMDSSRAKEAKEPSNTESTLSTTSKFDEAPEYVENLDSSAMAQTAIGGPHDTPDSTHVESPKYKEKSIELLVSAPAEFIFSAKSSEGRPAVQMLSNPGNLINDLRSYLGLEIEIVRTRTRAQTPVSAAAGASETSALLVKMDGEKGRLFAQQSSFSDSPIWVEENQAVRLFEGVPSSYFTTPDIAVVSDGSKAVSVSFRITGEDNTPLPMAMVKVFSSLNAKSIETISDGDGVARFQLPMTLFNTVAALVVEPHAGYWSKVVRRPYLKSNTTYNVQLVSFRTFDRGLTGTTPFSWGVRALGITTVTSSIGDGCKIGVIDSGCASEHSMLEHIKHGLDLNPDAQGDSWMIDEMGHGTHVCGIIGARGAGVRGMVPGAEIHMYKIFPKGDTFTLGAAIETAVSHGMDVINMSLTCGFSQDVTEQLAAARSAGVACFVAAGNEGREVMFPASMDTVMAVSALGHANTMPTDSVSGMTMLQESVTPDGYFLPNFSCFGNSIDFAGPGVGIISTVPGNDLKALDGTSMATPHIAGLAALYLQHHPRLAGMPRGLPRLELLYEILCRSSRSMDYQANRVGHGIPLAESFGKVEATMLASFFSRRGLTGHAIGI